MFFRRGRSRADEVGAAAVIMAVFVAALMIPVAAIGVDIARWYVQLERVQAAADAAATAGVTHMPDDFAAARARAMEIAEDNGYPDSGSSQVVVEKADKPTQLKVTVTSTIRNDFGQFMGMDTIALSRSAVADYNGPAPMGSPCNTFGNEPKGTAKAPSITSKLVAPVGAECSSTPDFWASINGPDIHKTQGEQFAARTCVGGEDGCDWAKKNTEFDPLGYFYMVRVTKVGEPVTLQIYDPASVPTGQQCEGRPKWSATGADSPNDWLSDAKKRYGVPPSATATGPGDSELCPGDNDMSASSNDEVERPTVTSFGLRQPTDTAVPSQGVPMPSCAKQFKGFSQSQVTTSALTKTNGAYNDGLASVFHQWVTLCTFTPTQVGDYYLQVRSNVAFNGTGTAVVTSGNPAIYSQAGDDTGVKGTAVNSFSLRAYNSSGGLSVSAWKSMRIFVNGPSAQTTFNLVRVIPAASGKTLQFGFFDVGEGAKTGATMKLLPPKESNMTAVTNCKATGFRNQSLSTCSLSISEAFNGKQQYISAPVPSTYTCNSASQGGCWWRVVVDFATSAGVHDATTWTADIGGEPVRLVE